MKKLICAILIVSVIFCSIAVSVSAAGLTLTGANYPTTLTKGSFFSVQGTVQSENLITAVKAGVYDQSGKSQFGYTATPWTTSYDVNYLDSYMSFSKLDTGTYTYKITASDTKTSDVVLLQKTFTVTATAAGLTLTGATYPTTLTKGTGFKVEGTVQSGYSITAVKAGVYDSSGKSQFEYTATPWTTSYNVNYLDSYMTFSKLDTGTYTYKIIASDTKTSNVVLLQKNFTVTSSAATASLTLTGATYPTSLTKGTGFKVEGTVKSDYSITSVKVGVYSQSGTAQFERTVNPGATSYNINSLDSYMTFSKLNAGTYTYKIVASDTKTSNVVLLQKNFTVTDSASASTLTLKDANYPTSYTKGTSFSVKGTVQSSYSITSVKVGVYNQSGTAQFERTVNPGTTSYNINNLDSYMTFSKLNAGAYTYKIVASDTKTSNAVLLQKTFTVLATTSVESGFNKVNWDFIDLSYWNEINSWDKIADAVDGVILRIGYRGTANRVIYYDNMFDSSYTSAKNKGLHVGCYFFSAALTPDEAVEEADFVIGKLKEYKCKMDMPIYFDMETDGQVALSQSDCTAVARAFCDRVTESGYFAGIYCNKYFARDELFASQLSDITFWIAEYNNSCTYTTGPYGMWQYSERGSVPGINGYVDMNYCYCDYPTYIAKRGLNGYPVTTSEPKPTYSVKSLNGVKVNTTSKVISRVPAKLTADKFKSTYLTYSSNVTVVFDKTVSGNIATGTTVTFKNGSTVLATYTISVLGDVDGNSVVNSSDALAVLEHSVGKKTLLGVKWLGADYTNDNAINSNDALEILKVAVG